jgi:hypothetical protein
MEWSVPRRHSLARHCTSRGRGFWWDFLAGVVMEPGRLAEPPRSCHRLGELPLDQRLKNEGMPQAQEFIHVHESGPRSRIPSTCTGAVDVYGSRRRTPGEGHGSWYKAPATGGSTSPFATSPETPKPRRDTDRSLPVPVRSLPGWARGLRVWARGLPGWARGLRVWARGLPGWARGLRVWARGLPG